MACIGIGGFVDLKGVVLTIYCGTWQRTIWTVAMT
jgi:hypothetical protein